MRSENRKSGQTREITIQQGVHPYASGFAEVSFGRTKVLVTATIVEECPVWLKGQGKGWITAEYGMLPSATHQRNRREAVAGKQTGRTMEIQRLIGRALRASVDLSSIRDYTINIDCDVIVADGGTRSAAICGAWVALASALDSFKSERPIILKKVAALSAGQVNGSLMVDLDYEEDSTADFDCNFVLTSKGEIIEVQGTAEGSPLEINQFIQLYELCKPGFDKIFTLQRECVADYKNIEISF
ncbi:MAG TPA: ribonuclease PH [Oligoflexia bacterium]|mgnify:CR=1 FL=1|nr:ribonuclease PH [Oligoflexia bacterium]HMP47817.1 ribonuclease PH [Oligoflexia bacterium]